MSVRTIHVTTAPVPMGSISTHVSAKRSTLGQTVMKVRNKHGISCGYLKILWRNCNFSFLFLSQIRMSVLKVWMIALSSVSAQMTPLDLTAIVWMVIHHKMTGVA